jgi:hypothetical protein
MLQMALGQQLATTVNFILNSLSLNEERFVKTFPHIFI